MKHLVLIAALLSLVLVVGPNAAQQGAVARFREVEQSHTVIGSFAGATETWRTTVLLPREAKAAGSGAVICIRVDRTSTLRECVGTYRLPEGTIQVAGTLTSRGRFSLMITAGSGVYAAKEGTAGFAQLASDPRQSFITFYFVN